MQLVRSRIDGLRRVAPFGRSAPSDRPVPARLGHGAVQSRVASAPPRGWRDPIGEPKAGGRNPAGAAGAALAAALALAPAGGHASDVIAGRLVYQEHCEQCHGAQGMSVMPGSPDFARGQGLQAPDPILIESVKRGKNLMPGYDRVISERNILNVVAYIRTLWR